MKLGALLAHCAIAIHYHSISDADSMGFGVRAVLATFKRFACTLRACHG